MPGGIILLQNLICLTLLFLLASHPHATVATCSNRFQPTQTGSKLQLKIYKR